MEATIAQTEAALDNETLVRAEGIEKTYDSVLPFSRSVSVLSRADLQIQRGELVGIVGANGVGKSTLMNILVGVFDHDGGNFKFITSG